MVALSLLLQDRLGLMPADPSERFQRRIGNTDIGHVRRRVCRHTAYGLAALLDVFEIIHTPPGIGPATVDLPERVPFLRKLCGKSGDAGRVTDSA